MQIPLDKKLKNIQDLPYTISYVIRKRQQIDNLNELPKEKRPTDQILWDGTSRELENWIERVMDKKSEKDADIVIKDIDIEG